MRVWFILALVLLAGCAQPEDVETSSSSSTSTSSTTEPSGSGSSSSSSSSAGSQASTLPDLHTDNFAASFVHEVTHTAYATGLGMAAGACIGPSSTESKEILGRDATFEWQSSFIETKGLTGSEFILHVGDESYAKGGSDPMPSAEVGPGPLTIGIEACRIQNTVTAVLTEHYFAKNAHPFIESDILWDFDNPEVPMVEQNPFKATVYPVREISQIVLSGDSGTEMNFTSGPITKVAFKDGEPEILPVDVYLQGDAMFVGGFSDADFVQVLYAANVELAGCMDVRTGDFDNDGGSGWTTRFDGVCIGTFEHPESFGRYQARDSSFGKIVGHGGNADTKIQFQNVTLGAGPHVTQGPGGVAEWQDVSLGGELRLTGTLPIEGLSFHADSLIRSDEDTSKSVRLKIVPQANVGYKFDVEGGAGTLDVDLPGIIVEHDGSKWVGQSEGYEEKAVKVRFEGRLSGQISTA